jgi:predicted DNA-binding mobile mystery protein A
MIIYMNFNNSWVINMKKTFQKMMRSQIQADLDDPATLVQKPVPKGGWLHVMRNVLGMSTYQLAKRLKCSQSNIAALERRERSGMISLNSLEKTAQALHCKLVYFLVPEKPFDALLEDQARLIAKKQLRSIEHSMELEQQGLTSTQKIQQEKALIEELLQGSPKALWEDEDEI